MRGPWPALIFVVALIVVLLELTKSHPLGSMAGPWPALIFVFALMVFLRALTKPHPLGSIPKPLPALMSVFAFMASSFLHVLRKLQPDLRRNHRPSALRKLMRAALTVGVDAASVTGFDSCLQSHDRLLSRTTFPHTFKLGPPVGIEPGPSVVARFNSCFYSHGFPPADSMPVAAHRTHTRSFTGSDFRVYSHGDLLSVD
jgi:hypothetical protein